MARVSFSRAAFCATCAWDVFWFAGGGQIAAWPDSCLANQLCGQTPVWPDMVREERGRERGGGGERERGRGGGVGG